MAPCVRVSYKISHTHRLTEYRTSVRWTKADVTLQSRTQTDANTGCIQNPRPSHSDLWRIDAATGLSRTEHNINPLCARGWASASLDFIRINQSLTPSTLHHFGCLSGQIKIWSLYKEETVDRENSIHDSFYEKHLTSPRMRGEFRARATEEFIK